MSDPTDFVERATLGALLVHVILFGGSYVTSVEHAFVACL